MFSRAAAAQPSGQPAHAGSMHAAPAVSSSADVLNIVSPEVCLCPSSVCPRCNPVPLFRVLPHTHISTLAGSEAHTQILPMVEGIKYCAAEEMSNLCVCRIMLGCRCGCPGSCSWGRSTRGWRSSVGECRRSWRAASRWTQQVPRSFPQTSTLRASAA